MVPAGLAKYFAHPKATWTKWSFSSGLEIFCNSKNGGSISDQNWKWLGTVPWWQIPPMLHREQPEQRGSPQPRLHWEEQGIWASVSSNNKGILETKTNNRNWKAFFKDGKHLDLFLMNLRILQRKQMAGHNKMQVHLARQPFTVAIVHVILLMHHRRMPATQHNSFEQTSLLQGLAS